MLRSYYAKIPRFKGRPAFFSLRILWVRTGLLGQHYCLQALMGVPWLWFSCFMGRLHSVSSPLARPSWDRSPVVAPGLPRGGLRVAAPPERAPGKWCQRRELELPVSYGPGLEMCAASPCCILRVRASSPVSLRGMTHRPHLSPCWSTTHSEHTVHRRPGGADCGYRLMPGGFRL